MARLEAQHQAQTAETSAYFRRRGEAGELNWEGLDADAHGFMADKLVALDRDKAEFCYLVCRAIGARRIVEAGTSFGVSTLYLAAAVRDNGGGTVIGAEYEPEKVKGARANFEAAGLSAFIELHEGDLIEAFKKVEGPIDFVLFDIWGDVVRPVLDLLSPHLRPGAVICADNTAGARGREGYAPFFAAIDDPAYGLRTMTLPFEGGFVMTVKVS